MGLVDGRKVYISRIDAATNTIELALWEELFKTEVWARNFNWLIDEPREPIRASVRVRHTKWENPPCTATVEDGLVHIVCDEPVRAPAAGQSAVLYDGDRLLGGDPSQIVDVADGEPVDPLTDAGRVRCGDRFGHSGGG